MEMTSRIPQEWCSGNGQRGLGWNNGHVNISDKLSALRYQRQCGYSSCTDAACSFPCIGQLIYAHITVQPEIINEHGAPMMGDAQRGKLVYPIRMLHLPMYHKNRY
jgi:hypothetical protein